MKTYYVWYDATKPNSNLVYVISNSDIDLVKVVVEVEDRSQIEATVRALLDSNSQ